MNNSGDTKTISNIMQLLYTVLSVFSRRETPSLTSVASSGTILCTNVTSVSMVTSSLFEGTILGQALTGAYEVSFINPSTDIAYTISAGTILIAKQTIV